MSDKKLLRMLGMRLLGWKFWRKLSHDENFPEPFDVLPNALAGKSGPIFWYRFHPEGGFFLAAIPGAAQAVMWDPLRSEKDRDHLLTALGERGGKVTVREGSLSAERVFDGYPSLYSNPSPRRICEAALWALSTHPEPQDLLS